MKDSVILQVDESTKGLMEEIQTGIASSIEDGLREVQDKVETVDGNTEMILRKFKNLDGLNTAIENLRTLAEQSKRFVEIVSPLQSNVNEIGRGTKANEQALSKAASNIDLLVKSICQLEDKLQEINLEMKTELQKVSSLVSGENKSIKDLLGNIIEKLNKADKIRQEQYGTLNDAIENVCGGIDAVEKRTHKIEDKLANLMSSHNDFIVKYSADETSQRVFENNTSSQIATINNSLAKVQATLDIIVNLVTPFWKKWKK